MGKNIIISFTKQQSLIAVLVCICIFVSGKIYYQWTTGPTKVITSLGASGGVSSVEAINVIFERLEKMDKIIESLSEAQAKLARKGVKKEKAYNAPVSLRSSFYLSQVKPGDICIFKATEKEESLTGLDSVRGRQVTYANQNGEQFSFTDTESGKTAFLRSSILSMMRAYRGGKFQMQANKKGRVIPKWYGNVCDHKGVMVGPLGEKSAFSARPCPTVIPWLLTEGVKEFNLNFLLDDDRSMWLEFGTRVGDTLKHLYKLRTNSGPIYSFDSFEGLPETIDGTPYKVGKYSVPLNLITLQSGWYASDPERVGIPGNVKLVPGWFNDTITPFIEQHKGDRIGLIHIDSNLYSSAKEVFEKLGSYIGPGTVIIFNEYTYCKDTDAYIVEQGPKAFFEFLASRPGLGAQVLASTKYSASWILLDKSDLPTWLRENKDMGQVPAQSGEGADTPTEVGSAAQAQEQELEEQLPALGGGVGLETEPAAESESESAQLEQQTLGGIELGSAQEEAKADIE